MKKYFIRNEKNNTTYQKEFKDSKCCYYWIVNNLDLSLNWTCADIIDCDAMKKEIDNLKTNMVEIIAPFNGFYNTVHGGNVEGMVECYTDGEDGKIKEDNTDYKKTHVQYCKDWISELESLINNEIDENFIKEIKLKFKDLESPKYYNFENDRLFISIGLISMQKIKALITKDYSSELEKELKEKFTSCDGFSSHYPNNTKEFLTKEEDCNTRGVYFKIFLESVLEIKKDDLNYLVEEVEIIFNDDTEKEK